MENKKLSTEIYTKEEVDLLIKNLKKPNIYIKGMEKRKLKRWEGIGYQTPYIFRNLEFDPIIGVENSFGKDEFIFKAPYESQFYFELQIGLSLSEGENPVSNFQSEKYHLAATFKYENKDLIKNFMLSPFKSYSSDNKDSGILLGGTNTCLYLLKDESVRIMISCRAIAAFPENTVILPKHTYLIISN